MIPYLRGRAALRGPLGGSRGWTIVWGVLLAARVLRWLTRPKQEVLLLERVGPGETLLISGVDREPRVVGGSESS
jgi:hypothetical protein